MLSWLEINVQIQCKFNVTVKMVNLKFFMLNIKFQKKIVLCWIFMHECFKESLKRFLKCSKYISALKNIDEMN